MKSLCFILFFCYACLSVCLASNYSKNYYLEHPDKLISAIKSCGPENTNTYNISNTSANCQNVFFAMTTFQSLWQDFQRSPNEYGMKIMSLQIDASDLQEKIASASSSAKKPLQKQLNEIQAQINLRYGLLKMLSSSMNR